MGGSFLHIPILLAQEETQTSFAGLGVYLALTLGIIAVFFYLVKQGLTGRVFQGAAANCGEQLYLFIENMCISTIGARGRKYIPMIMTLWLVIFTGNLIAVFAPFAPTGLLSFNLGMAITSVAYVQYEGIRANGLGGHLKHFTGPKLTGPMVVISGLLFIIELISEIMKNISLSLRLYGNIHGGHVAVATMNGLTEKFLIPLGAFLLPIKLMTVVVQALIFTLLTCVYISLVTHHDHD